MSTRLRWHGDRVDRQVSDALADGLGLGTEHLLAESRRVVPIEEHILEASGATDVDRHLLDAAVSYDTVYAVPQHEELTWRHDPGRTAKYLETPFNAEQDALLELVAAPVRELLRR